MMFYQVTNVANHTSPGRSCSRKLQKDIIYHAHDFRCFISDMTSWDWLEITVSRYDAALGNSRLNFPIIDKRFFSNQCVINPSNLR